MRSSGATPPTTTTAAKTTARGGAAAAFFVYPILIAALLRQHLPPPPPPAAVTPPPGAEVGKVEVEVGGGTGADHQQRHQQQQLQFLQNHRHRQKRSEEDDDDGAGSRGGDSLSSPCQLYMAKSTIPNGGWGVFTAVDRPYDDDEDSDDESDDEDSDDDDDDSGASSGAIEPMDVSIPFPDYDYQMELQAAASSSSSSSSSSEDELPEWLLKDYHWLATATQAMYDADFVHAITPGLGMLANSHTYWFNLENRGCLTRRRAKRGGEKNSNNATAAAVGSASHCHDMAFAPTYDSRIRAGDELFVEYGDAWFEEREEALGGEGAAIPLHDDYERVDRRFVQKWGDFMGRALNGTSSVRSGLARDVWEMLVVPVKPLITEPRVRAALPTTYEDAIHFYEGRTPSNFARTLGDLRTNGMCLDNLRSKESSLVPNQRGAFASRQLSEGQIIAPVPVIPISRKHLEIRVVALEEDETGSNDGFWWKGFQLLLNYCYGHKDSSLLLFPYSPGVNLVNHAGGVMLLEDDGGGVGGRSGEKERMEPNVALRWSSLVDHNLLAESVDEILHKPKASGLMMELIALRDIQEGEELLLDYGANFDASYRKHLERFEPPVHADDYESAWDYEMKEELPTVDDDVDDEYPPSYIQPRCWVDVAEALSAQGNSHGTRWYGFVRPNSILIDATVPCTILSAEYDENDEITSYRIRAEVIEGEEDESYHSNKAKTTRSIKMKNVPRDAITYVEKPYTGNQFLRQSFRQEILLPDDVFPEAWKDLRPPGAYHVDKCGLYMAESAIPNSGMGMYTTKPYGTSDRIFHGDVVVMLEDYHENMRLRELYRNSSSSPEPAGEFWFLLTNYYWDSQTTFSLYEGDSISSIIPGLGMLANSHPGLVNAEVEAPHQYDYYLNRSKDPGAGASSAYHDGHFYAPRPIGVGEELFVDYGQKWFEDRTDLGKIPLKRDFVQADSLIDKFHRTFKKGSLISAPDLVKDAWNLIQSFPLRERLKSALPKTVEEAEKAAQTGTASHSTPNRFRSIEWLEKNGRCLDNIYPAESTIPQAGKGAFATRLIKKGGVAATLPLIQILRKDLEVYEEIVDAKDGPSITFEGYQQLLNYCYGHPQSSLLLFPYAPVTNYINHDAASPNVKPQWSTLSKVDWLNRHPKDLASQEHAGLVIELIAMRDIKPDEEVLLSYGDVWEEAWNNHVASFKPLSDDYVPASVFNRRAEWLRTEEELDEEPYPDNLMTVCFIGNRDLPSHGTLVWEYIEGILYDPNNSYPCEILERGTNGVDVDNAYDRKDSIDPADIRYTARVEDLTITDVPRQAIRFFDKPYSSDLFLRSAFRHEIALPDSMVPAAWRDLS